MPSVCLGIVEAWQFEVGVDQQEVVDVVGRDDVAMNDGRRGDVNVLSPSLHREFGFRIPKLLELLGGAHLPVLQRHSNVSLQQQDARLQELFPPPKKALVVGRIGLSDHMDTLLELDQRAHRYREMFDIAEPPGYERIGILLASRTQNTCIPKESF